MDNSYHVPVLGHEVCDLLLVNKNGVYMDGTLGGGGHAQMILEQISQDGMYIGIDRDEEALAFATGRLKYFKNFKAVKSTFDGFDTVLNELGCKRVDGILLDLGISSHQIDEDTRGFAYRKDLKLDMRMDRRQDITAEWIVNTYEKDDLLRIFRDYGEERFSGRIAAKIINERSKTRIDSAGKLLKIIDACVNPRFTVKSYARIFQALRIAVNDELNILQKALEKTIDFLVVGGRLAVISYHSLEDRIVKKFIQKSENPCECPPGLPVCVCGKVPVLRRVKPYPVVPGDEEIRVNSRARSAKMRVAERI